MAPRTPVPPTSDPVRSASRGGRPRAFEEDTVKVALFLPPDLAWNLKALAARHRVTPSLMVAEWLRQAEIREEIAQGRRDFDNGDTVTHEEAVERLSKW